MKTDEEKKAAKNAAAKKYREVNKEQAKAYVEANKLAIAEYRAKYYQENKEQLIKKQKKYTIDNKELIAERAKAYNKKNKVEIALKSKKYYDENTNRIKVLAKKYRESDPVRARNYSLKKICFTVDIFNKLLDEQNNKCAICHVDFVSLTKSKACADHCHTEMKPRGLLCNSCNTGLGMFKDNKTALLAAIAYLEKHDAKN